MSSGPGDLSSLFLRTPGPRPVGGEMHDEADRIRALRAQLLAQAPPFSSSSIRRGFLFCSLRSVHNYVQYPHAHSSGESRPRVLPSAYANPSGESG
jgi:hypothetical protein